MPSLVSSRIGEAAYRAQQLALLSHFAVAQRMLAAFSKKPAPIPPSAAFQSLRSRYDALLARDLANVEEGLYPRALLFQFPYGTYARRAPLLVRDLPRQLRRRRSRNFKDLPQDVTLDAYPAYFRRNFHWQTDGYLSRRSAELYDIGVELLFLGTADVMRRQIIPPITKHLRERSTRSDVRVLDVGCGTGRTLHQLSRAHPNLHYYGLDLSKFYLDNARSVLSSMQNLTLVAENAESLPFRDDYFDVVSSTYVLHELPRNVRRKVLAEMARVVRSDGLLIVQDSSQLSESADIGCFLDQFSRDFHEPFHADYLRNPVEEVLVDLGLDVTAIESHFVSKVVVARKP